MPKSSTSISWAGNPIWTGGDEGQPYSSVLPSNLQDQSNIQFYYNSIYYTGPVGLTSLEPVTNAGANYSYFGPEITFGADMAAYQNPSGVEVAIIKYSVGSSSLAGNWFAGGTRHDGRRWATATFSFNKQSRPP